MEECVRGSAVAARGRLARLERDPEIDEFASLPLEALNISL